MKIKERTVLNESKLEADLAERILSELKKIEVEDPFLIVGITKKQIEEVINGKSISDIEVKKVDHVADVERLSSISENKLLVYFDGIRTLFEHSENGVSTSYEFFGERLYDACVKQKKEKETLIGTYWTHPNERIDSATWCIKEYQNDYLEKVEDSMKEGTGKTREFGIKTKSQLDSAIIHGHSTLSHNIMDGTEWDMNTEKVFGDISFSITYGLDRLKKNYENNKKYNQENIEGWIDRYLEEETMKL